MKGIVVPRDIFLPGVDLARMNRYHLVLYRMEDYHWESSCIEAVETGAAAAVRRTEAVVAGATIQQEGNTSIALVPVEDIAGAGDILCLD